MSLTRFCRKPVAYILPETTAAEAAVAMREQHVGSLVVVREEQPAERLHTPRYGIIETRLRASADPRCMIALWMIGYEDRPERSGEICVFEIFGRDVASGRAGVGMGVHPHHDVPIHRLLSVRVTTSPRLVGRATRGLSNDLARMAGSHRGGKVLG